MKFKFELFAALIVFLFIGQSAFAQNPVNQNWRQYATEHFIVYYPEGQELTAFHSIEVAEKVYGALSEMYGPVDSKIRIVIKDTEDFANGGAFFYDNKIEISATNLDYDFRSYTDWLWNVVTHELTHVFSIKQGMKAPRMMPMMYFQQIDYQQEKREDVLVGYPNVMVSYPIPMFNIPAWLAEGVAQYQARKAHFDRWDAHRDMIVRQASLNDKLLTIDQMGSFNWTGRENEMVYNHGYSLIIYIANKYGDDKINAIMKAMGSSTAWTFDVACNRVLGIHSNQLYKEWKQYLHNSYTSTKDSLGTLVEGEVFRKGGFINGYPTWSPGGTKLAYVSNKGRDYSSRSCYIANIEPDGWKWKGKQKEEKKYKNDLEKEISSAKDSTEIANIIDESKGNFDIALAQGIQSSPVWLDEWNILYNRYMPSDKYGSHWWDIYRYVINTQDNRKGHKKRITHNMRGTYPDLSPDKRNLVFVKNNGGYSNLYLMKRGNNALVQLTKFTDGTRFYSPKWSPDGSKIVFTIHQGDNIDIAVINSDGSELNYLVTSDGQDRDPAWSPDGKYIYFSSDLNGIPNIYRIKFNGGEIVKLTNVIGGAFSPAPSPDDSLLAFSYYGPEGFEIRFLKMTDGFNEDSSIFHKHTAPNEDIKFSEFNSVKSAPHKMETLDFSLMPRVLNDQGNMKYGMYLSKMEVTDKGSFFFGGDISPTNKDTDIFALFEYKQFVPTVFIEMYRQTRSVDKYENFMEEFGTITKKRVFDLNEVDFGLKYTYHDSHNFESRLIYSRYNAKVFYTHYLTGNTVNKPYYTYSQGFDFSLSYELDNYMRTRDEDINPRGGRKISVRYDRFTDFFLNDFENVGFLKENYVRYPYNRYFVNWIERIPVPKTKKHTLNLRTQISLIDHQIDSFYESQLGGPQQMRGYTFYSMSGRKNVMGQALYRFPVFYDIRKNFVFWYLNNLYMGVFADVGKAWNKESLNFSTSGFKRDAGVEMRLDLISFYSFPTRIELSAAYGPDDTWINYYDSKKSMSYLKKTDQDPWKFYFNVLFGYIQ